MLLISRHQDDTFDLLFTHDEARWANNAMLKMSGWMEHADVMNTIKVVCNAYDLAHKSDGVLALKGIDPVCRLTRHSLQHVLASVEYVLTKLNDGDLSAMIGGNRSEVDALRASLTHTLSDLST